MSFSSSRLSDREFRLRQTRYRDFVARFNSFKALVRRSPLRFESADQSIIAVTRLLVRPFNFLARSLF
jgi:hypothetical protein